MKAWIRHTISPELKAGMQGLCNIHPEDLPKRGTEIFFVGAYYQGMVDMKNLIFESEFMDPTIFPNRDYVLVHHNLTKTDLSTWPNPSCQVYVEDSERGVFSRLFESPGEAVEYARRKKLRGQWTPIKLEKWEI